MGVRRKKEFTEGDLYQPLKLHLEEQGYMVKAEVKACDVVATREEEVLAFELKKSFNLKLIYQCLERLKYADAVYAVVAAPKEGQMNKAVKDAKSLLSRIGIGLVLVYLYESGARVQVVLQPTVIPVKKNSRLKKVVLREFNNRSGSYNIGGTKGEVATAYREAAIHCAVIIETLGASSPAQIRKIGGPENCGPLMNNNYYGWFNKVSRGVYDNTKAVKKAMKQYKDIASYYRKKYRKLSKAVVG